MISLFFRSSLLAQGSKPDSSKVSTTRDTIPTRTTENEIIRAGDLSEVPNILSTSPSTFSYSRSGLSFGYSFLNTRGFDQRRQAIFIDGVPQNDPEDHNVYWTIIPDLAASASEIQIQRGAGDLPGGSLALGGSINIKTNPSRERAFNISAGYGDYNTSKLGITLNSGLIDDRYIIYARLSQMKSDGYRNGSSLDEKSYRISLERIDSAFTLRLNFYGGPVRGGLNYYGIFPGADNDRLNFTDPSLRKVNWSESFMYERRAQEHEEFFQPHYEATGIWNIDANTLFSNTLFYIQGNGFNDYDGTAPFLSRLSNSEYYRVTPIYGLRYNFTGITDSSLGSELVRGSVSTNQFGWLPKLEFWNTRSTFTLGGEFRFERSDHWGQLLSANEMPVGLPGDYHFYDYKGGKNILSGYASEKYDFSEMFTATASVQLLSQEYKFFDEKPFYLDSAAAAFRGITQTGWTNYTFNVPLFFVNPRLAMTVVLNDFISISATAAITTREPRLKDYYNAEFFSLPNFARKADGTFDLTKPTIDPEHLVDIELWTTFARYPIDDDVIFSGKVGGYYMPFNEEILQTGFFDRWGSPQIANAEKVDHYGLELETSLEFGTAARLNLNLSASHNEIKEFTRYADSISVVGKVPIGFPSLIGGAGLVLYPAKGLVFSLTAKYVGSMYGDLINSDYYRNDPYAVVDAMLSYRENNILGMHYVELRLNVSNILNKLYTSYVEYGSGFYVAAPRHGFGTLEIGL
ncbi:MAG: TonB-dependent receptor plug domain-containing protein [Bacteroidota bacterium]|nr:TonB-dependent receptor plug domain-containing protein [Bacteroidota bacterium]